ncbi:MAG: hypothetical protein ACYS30_10530 [Planctomycetota bacterium]|jgi:hypothetical protein
MLAEKGKATAGETMAKPLQHAFQANITTDTPRSQAQFQGAKND